MPTHMCTMLIYSYAAHACIYLLTCLFTCSHTAYDTTHAGTYTPSLENTYTPTYIYHHICSSIQIYISSLSHTHICTMVHSDTHSHICMSTSTELARAPPMGGLPLLAFPSGFYLLFLAMMSIFGKGSIFALSGSIFPLGHELGQISEERPSCHVVDWEG